MSKDTPTPPTPPDPYQVAAAQTGSNIKTATANAALNRVNQTGPLGSSTYQITGYNPDGTPIYSQATTLNPQEQQILGQFLAGQGAAGAVGAGIAAGGLGGLGTPFSTAGLPGVTSQVTNGAGSPGAITDAEKAAFGTQEQFLQPIQQQQQQLLHDQLVNQGLQPGSEAYNNAMAVLNNSQNQQTQAALNAGVTAGQQEQATLFGQGLAGAGLQNTANAQALGQALQQRELPLQEYAALQGVSQPAMPSFPNVPGATMAPTDISSDIYNTYQGELNTYNAQMGAANSQTAGLFGLGGAVIQGALGIPSVRTGITNFLSDERTKKNIKTIGKTPGGNRVVAFDYKKEFEPFGFGGTGNRPVAHAPHSEAFGFGGKGKHIGVIAQEVERKQPGAVHRGPGGMRVVDYRKVA